MTRLSGVVCKLNKITTKDRSTVEYTPLYRGNHMYVKKKKNAGWNICLGQVREPDMSILWYRSVNCELNHRKAVPEIKKILKKNVMINCIKRSRNI